MKISRKGQKRYDNFIEVGFELFLQKGYEGTSLNDIVKISGGSLSSIYKYFNNKEGLFEAIFDKKFNEFCSELDFDINLKSTNNLEGFLYRFGLAFFEIFHKPFTISLLRIIISESYKNKELGRMFIDKVISKVAKILIDFFNKDDIKPLIKNSDNEAYLELLAYKFCAFIKEPFFLRALYAGDDKIQSFSKKEKEAMVRSVVDIFINGICL